MENNTQGVNKEEHSLKLLLFQYIPYWPLFLLLMAICGAGAWTYLYFTTPMYQATANILIKDEKKGVDNPEAIESLDIYTPKNIVENEIKVIQSRELMKEVVKKLNLYAPVFEEDGMVSRSAYTSSPITIEAQEPDKLQSQEKVYFKYVDSQVVINNHRYPLNAWVTTPYGVLKFSPNPNLYETVDHPYYFSLMRPKSIANYYIYSMDVEPSSKTSSVLTLTLQDEVPSRAENILNELIDKYNSIAVDEKKTLAANTMTFVEDRINHVVRELDSIEGKIQKFKSSQGVVDLDAQGKLFLQNVGDNDRKLSDINMKLAVLNQVEKYVTNKDTQAGIVPSTLGVDDPMLSRSLQQLYDSELQYEKLKKTVAEGNPIMQSLKNEIESIRPHILENIKNQRDGLIASRSNISATNGMYGSVLQSIPQKERELIEVSRQHAIKNDVYSFLLHKREETALAYAASVAESRVIDKAQASGQPVSPNKSFIYLGAFALAFMLGIGWVSGRELLSNKVLFRSEIEEVAPVPVAAEITKVPGKQHLVVNDPEKIFIAEQFRQLRAAIGLYGKKAKKKKLLVTSSIPGEGKSFMSNNLALSLALAGKKVVLLDMDMRNPVTSSVFKMDDRNGVAEYLEEEATPDAIVYSTEYNNLFVVPAGRATMNPTELLLSKNVGGLMDYLENSFDYIIVDAAPIDPVTDAYVLSEYCTDTLFVIRHNYTPKAMVKLLEANNTFKVLKNIAIAFNGVKPRGFVKKDYGFGYGYGYTKVYGEKTYMVKNTGKKA